MRLIDADALNPKFVNGRFEEAYVSEKELMDAPTIDPVKHGKWEKHVLKNANVPWGHDCSSCGEWFVVGEIPLRRYRYCPNCGARMDG